MREKTRSTIWAIVCAVVLLAGEVAGFFFAWQIGVGVALTQALAFLLGFILAPIVHELGHIIMAKRQDMQVVYAKFSFLKIYDKNGKNRLGFASPFAMDETQVIPKMGGDMQKRASRYTLGGLIFGGVYFAILILVSVLLTLLGLFYPAFAFWGLTVYAGYLFLLNVLPLTYNLGKTDMAVYLGIKKGEPAEKTLLSAMEIQGNLYAGKSYGEIDESLYFNLPQLAEDEPLFVVILDLRYRYWLDKGEFKKASDCLNRLAQAGEYLTADEEEKISAEFVYMHALNGDREKAEACSKGCAEYLQGETATAKRILTAVAILGGKTDSAQVLKEQAKPLLEREKVAGNRKFEESLLARL